MKKIKKVVKRMLDAARNEKKDKEIMEKFEDKDLEKIFIALRESDIAEFIRYLKSPWWIIANNFLAGIFRGLGIIIGMTVVFALMIWFLTKFVDFPVIGEYFQDILNILKQFQPNQIAR
jgi:hypothetical protein